MDKEFWLGNDFIHKLTSDENAELRIVLVKDWGQYSLFKVDSEESNYNLNIREYRGSMKDNLHMTYDRQNDNNTNVSCASP